MDDFMTAALLHVARKDPATAFDALAAALDGYQAICFEDSKDDMPIDDGTGEGTMLSSRTSTIDLSDADSDDEDSLCVVADCTYADGTRAIHLPRESVVLVRRGSKTELKKTDG